MNLKLPWYIRRHYMISLQKTGIGFICVAIRMEAKSAYLEGILSSSI